MNSESAIVQYCPNVMRANFNEIHDSEFQRNSCFVLIKIAHVKCAKFRNIERNFEPDIEKWKKVFDGGKYQREFALNRTKYQGNFAKLSHAKFRSDEMSVKICVQWNETAVQFCKTETCSHFGTKRSNASNCFVNLA